MTIIVENRSAVLDDLYCVEGKAELYDGKIVPMPPTGYMPGNAAGLIYASLLTYARRTKASRALPDNVGFAVDLPHRKSFSPDAAFHTGPRTGMRFLRGAPVFTVEVRSESDYGSIAEDEMARKRADYFAAGSVVVWDVDLLGEAIVRKFTAESGAEHPVHVFRRGEAADAEPALPEWVLLVDELFDDD